jgi:hypothetical protein
MAGAMTFSTRMRGLWRECEGISWDWLGSKWKTVHWLGVPGCYRTGWSIVWLADLTRRRSVYLPLVFAC